jgi:hypothetical protein
MNRNLLTLLLTVFVIALNAQVHTSYLWHLQQPIYWPEQGNSLHYQTVKESQDIKFSGGNQYGTGSSHPFNDLEEIFSKADRVAIYQYRAKNTVQNMLGYTEAGAQVNYSGCLIENINSLANASQWGYNAGWQNDFTTAREWETNGGNPRMDIVAFTFHHALSPLVSEKALAKEIQAHRVIYGNTFGTNPNYSKGYWPAEGSFSERIIKVLVEEGIEWSIIANSHLARTLNDYPLNYGTSGCNISPPNKADKVSTNGNNWWNGQIDGRGGTFAAPYCYQAHKAKYVDPETGQEYKITVVPMADLLSYKDGFSQQGAGDIVNNIKPYDDPSHPSIVLLSHDGDNAWGGGASYYQEAVPSFMSDVSNNGIVPTTIQQFLDDHPVPDNNVVKVEDGSWVNAANDWGHPQFINWLWPLYDPSTYEFNPNGWTEDARNWAVITAIDNYAIMAEDLAGSVDINDIVYPSASSSDAELAWHYYLPALTSGYMYYGKALDMEVKQTIAGNNAIGYAQNVIDANPGVDNTPPSVFIPQRFPYNPGGPGFGPIYGYQEHINTQDFTVWTFGYDVNGINSAVLKYRTDNDGENPLSSNENETYAGGSGVSSWNTITMNSQAFPTGNVMNDPEIDFFVLPDAMSNLYYAEITGLDSVLVDYYVEMTDNNGNTFKTPIQHVWVGAQEGGGGGSGSETISWSPQNPSPDDVITVTVTDADQDTYLHWGVNSWNEPITGYWPPNTTAWGDGNAVQTQFSYDSEQDAYTVEIGPFNNPDQTVDNVSFVIYYGGSGYWDNNNGNDFYINIEEVGLMNEDFSHWDVKLFPNPSVSKSHIQIVSPSSIDHTVALYDLSGRKIKEFQTSEKLVEISTSDLQNSIYYVKVTNNKTGKSKTESLVIY